MWTAADSLLNARVEEALGRAADAGQTRRPASVRGATPGARAVCAVDRRFPLEAESAVAARREIETLTLDADEASVLALLVTELITNSVRHSMTNRNQKVGLQIQVTDETVTVSVTDAGHGFVAPFRTDASPPESHWGLHLLDSLADRWEITANPSTAVSFELDRPTQPQGEQPDGEPLDWALAEQARLSDAYARAVGTSSEMASYERLLAANRKVNAAEATFQRRLR